MEFVPDQGVNMEFYQDSMQSQYQSEQQGHPVFVSMPFVRIQVPGSQNTIIEVPVDETHRKRFPVQWRRFQAGELNEVTGGWPLETWPTVNSAQVKTLKYMGVHTVEQLAGLSDDTATKIGPGTIDLRTKAKAMLAAAKDNAATEKFAVENKRLQDQLESQADELAELRAMITGQAKGDGESGKDDKSDKQDAEPAKRGPGRPPRNA